LYNGRHGVSVLAGGAIPLIFGLGKEIAVTHRMLEREIARNLGILETALSFSLVCNRFGVEIRVPAPGARELDCLPPEETQDVVGQGKTSQEAIVDVSRRYFVAQHCHRSTHEAGLSLQ